MIGALLVVALSQTSPKKAEKAPAPEHIVFGEDPLKGQIAKPPVEFVFGKPKSGFESLINLRMSMDDKLHESTDNL